MSTLPAFHTKAKQEAQSRAENAKGESTRASDFLDALDEILESDK
jgi:hypothetical protein